VSVIPRFRLARCPDIFYQWSVILDHQPLPRWMQSANFTILACSKSHSNQIPSAMLILKSSLALLLGLFLWFPGPGGSPAPQADNGFTIDAKIKPIIDAKCLGCHSADSKNEKPPPPRWMRWLK
jgi:hypothetical protein